MWYLLSVMQVLILLRSFTAWPALIDECLQQVLDAITLEPLVKPMLDFGKSKFELADDQSEDPILKS